MKKLIIFIAGLFLFTACYAVPLELTPKHPISYVVKSGDTLWSVSSKFLLEPWQWPKLWHANPDIKNPDLIYPGDVLQLYQHNGQYQLRRVGRGTVKLYPQAKSSPLEEAIPVIPYGDIKPFLGGVQVISPFELENAAYILALPREAVVGGNGSHIFVRGVHWKYRKYYSIFRIGKDLRDPQTGKILGLAAVNVGEARLIHRQQPSTMVVTKAFREVQIKDRVLPMPARISATDFYPQPPSRVIHGEIISLLDEATIIGQYHVVIIDRGYMNGLRRGDVLAIFRRGRLVADPMAGTFHHEGEFHGFKSNSHPPHNAVQLPNERIGNMLIFRVFQHVSYALVMNAKRPIEKFDLVQNP